MKRSEQLKIQRQQKISEMQLILDGAVTGGVARALDSAEQTKFDGMTAEITALDGQITAAEAHEARSAQGGTGGTNPALHQRDGGGFEIMKKASRTYNASKAIRQFSARKLDGLEAEAQAEIKARTGILSDGLLIPTTAIYNREENNQFKRANENTTVTHASVNDVFVHPDLSIFGAEPLYEKMGCTILDGVTGSLKLSKKAPSVGQQVAENAALANNSDNPSLVATLTPKRYGDKDVWTSEQLAQENPQVHAKLIADLLKGADRKVSAALYAVMLAGATAAPTATAMNEASMNVLMAAVDGDGSFTMSRSTFFKGKAVVFDAGSGLRLFARPKGAVNGIGESWEGVEAFYSTLFTDGVNQQYVIYGDNSEVFIPRWGAIELLFDPYTLIEQGQTKVVVNRLLDMAVRNPAAFAKSADMDAV